MKEKKQNERKMKEKRTKRTGKERENNKVKEE